MLMLSNANHDIFIQCIIYAYYYILSFSPTHGFYITFKLMYVSSITLFSCCLKEHCPAEILNSPYLVFMLYHQMPPNIQLN